jgi:hypothetical protein
VEKKKRVRKWVGKEAGRCVESGHEWKGERWLWVCGRRPHRRREGGGGSGGGGAHCIGERTRLACGGGRLARHKGETRRKDGGGAVESGVRGSCDGGTPSPTRETRVLPDARARRVCSPDAGVRRDTRCEGWSACDREGLALLGKQTWQKARAFADVCGCPLVGVSWCPVMKKGTHLFASRSGHLRICPQDRRFQCAPAGHISAMLSWRFLTKFLRFRNGQQPKLREVVSMLVGESGLCGGW